MLYNASAIEFIVLVIYGKQFYFSFIVELITLCVFCFRQTGCWKNLREGVTSHALLFMLIWMRFLLQLRCWIVQSCENFQWLLVASICWCVCISLLLLQHYLALITFRVSRRRHEMCCGHVCLYVCLFVRGRMPTLLHGPRCNFGEW